ncbi:Chromosome (plasmid) partitioning protein ParB [hydrothermal vent metagenome]|uniref:Chromosome (Plasmid) partitioning protein ParB n=1 Tax=hydrothermal vent metagenome TaxID=652676 RepID=A0A1W1BSX4_9ZZZZ
MKKNKLGRGLDVLLANTTTTLKTTLDSNEKLEEIPVSLLQRGKFQPRNDINPETLSELTQSIKSQGIIQPIVAREIATNQYEIIAGERRWRAAQLAGLSKVPVIVREISDKIAIAIGLIENIQRESLTPIEEASALEELIENFSMTHAEVAEVVGRSRSAVTNLIRLLQLNSKVKILLNNGDIQMGHGRAILPLNHDEQLEIANKIIDKDLSVRQAEVLVKKVKNTDKNIEKIEKESPDFKELINELTHKLGQNIDIKQTTQGNGKIVINYKNEAEFKKTIEKLQKI